MRRPSRPVPQQGESESPRRPRSRDEQREALLAYAFRSLGAKALTAAELHLKLQRRSDDETLVSEVLARVQELGYQNDSEVARSEGQRRGVGQFRVRQNLKRRGLGAELIEETMQARDPDVEQQAATDLLSRRWPGLARKRDPKASAYALLARRGFPSAVIWQAIREVTELLPDEEVTDWQGED